VDEDISSAFAPQKAEALCVVEPLHRTLILCQFVTPYFGLSGLADRLVGWPGCRTRIVRRRMRAEWLSTVVSAPHALRYSTKLLSPSEAVQVTKKSEWPDQSICHTTPEFLWGKAPFLFTELGTGRSRPVWATSPGLPARRLTVYIESDVPSALEDSNNRPGRRAAVDNPDSGQGSAAVLQPGETAGGRFSDAAACILLEAQLNE
jgi:hypothetical protein